MSKLTRRDFLRTLAVGAGGAIISGCGQPTPAITSAPSPTKAPLPSPSIVPPTQTPIPATAVPTAAPTATPVPYPDMVVARGGKPEDMVQRAINALGGMKKFVKQGDDVIIKPNICIGYYSYEYAATTNPFVVSTLVKLCNEAGAKRVRVMDFPFGSSPQQSYTASGIEKEVKAAGGQMEIMNLFKYISSPIPDGKDLKKDDFYDDILKANVVINVPIAKHHSLARLTLGMKNIMGTIKEREKIHSNMGQRIADLVSRVRPSLTIIDAVRILMANGPTGGSLNDVKKLDTIIASADIVAADSYATTLFGLKPEDISYIKAGAAMGLGKMDLKSMKIEEIAV